VRIIVLGAGVVGVTAAWYLARDGHEVTVVDRQNAAAQETSFANGGQVAGAFAEPWASPKVPKMLREWWGREDAPLLFRPRADLAQWLWSLAFLAECRRSRYEANIRETLTFGSYSLRETKALRAEVGVAHDALDRGVLQIYFNAADLERAATYAEAVRAYGATRVPKSAAECVAVEPALADVRGLAGGIYAPPDVTGDARMFAEGLAARGVERGIRYRFGVSIESLATEGGRVSGVRAVNEEGRKEVLGAEAFVVALGSWAPRLLAPIGVRIPVYPVKGYSATIAVSEPASAPQVSITDIEKKIVLTRLGERLRVAGTAELAGYDTSLNEARCRLLFARARELFPRLPADAEVKYWAGLRPATPTNLPVIGRTRYPNLFLDTGHGTLGWTYAAGSGRVLADVVAGRTPAVKFSQLAA
jgi:D-amino-acid dehydrogenase